jgi:hypothetical protein
VLVGGGGCVIREGVEVADVWKFDVYGVSVRRVFPSREDEE